MIFSYWPQLVEILGYDKAAPTQEEFFEVPKAYFGEKFSTRDWNFVLILDLVRNQNLLRWVAF